MSWRQLRLLRECPDDLIGIGLVLGLDVLEVWALALTELGGETLDELL